MKKIALLILITTIYFSCEKEVEKGIETETTSEIKAETLKYPGIKISYKSNIGFSSKDNYFMYFDKDTKKMIWLGYTVTYFSKIASDKTSLIRYNDWGNVNGFLLPKSITWYKKDAQGNPTEPKAAAVRFLASSLSKTSLDASFYEKPTSIK
ncbi:hypothetical protein PJJ26_04030 [Tenacibaculum finnmarkense]|nr:hypothetical protein PJJ26_04030 [Tenacibaculum finnmarkense]